MNQTELVKRLLSMTREIEQASALADWPEAAHLVEERSALLLSLTSEQTPDSLATIREIQAIDAATLANAQTTQSELEAEYNGAMERVKVVDLYHKMALL